MVSSSPAFASRALVSVQSQYAGNKESQMSEREVAEVSADELYKDHFFQKLMPTRVALSHLIYVQTPRFLSALYLQIEG